MSSAAATIPGKRDDYLKHRAMKTIPPKPSSKVSNTVSQKGPTTKKGRAQPNPIKTAEGPGNKESSMKRTGRALQSGVDILSPGRTPISKTTSNGMNSDTSSQLKGDKLKIKIISIPEYEELTGDREHLIAQNAQLKTRIGELETETSKVLAEFGALYNENAELRNKMDTGSEPLLEPYSRVFDDRKILRDAEKGYKKRITRLEQELKDSKQAFDKLEKDLKKTKAKGSNFTELKENESKLAKLHWENKNLNGEVEKLKSEVSELQTKLDSAKSTPRVVPSTQSRPRYSMQERKSNVKLTPRQQFFEYEYYLPDSNVYYNY